MAKQHRVTAPRPSRTRRPPGAPAKQKAGPRHTRAARPAAIRAASPRAAASAAVATPLPPAPPPRKPAYYEAIAAYETGVRALQRHDFQTAAEQFRLVIDRHPDERELVDRASLFLRVCDRETAKQQAGPRTPRERIYAATVALNAGDPQAALGLLRQALEDEPANDHGHYILAVALTEQRRHGDALSALSRAIELNSENRAVARSDPDLADLRELDACQSLLQERPEPLRRRSKMRREG